MSAQAPKLIDLILCDEVRREDNGKLLVLGMYLGAILVPRIPFRMPNLSFLCKWRIQGSVPTGEFRVINPKKEALGGFQMGADGDMPPGSSVFYMTFTLQNIQLSQTGTYKLTYKPPKGKRYQTISTFEVRLRDEGQ